MAYINKPPANGARDQQGIKRDGWQDAELRSLIGHEPRPAFSSCNSLQELRMPETNVATRTNPGCIVVSGNRRGVPLAGVERLYGKCLSLTEDAVPPCQNGLDESGKVEFPRI